MNRNLDIFGACRHKTTFHPFFLMYDLIFYQTKGTYVLTLMIFNVRLYVHTLNWFHC